MFSLIYKHEVLHVLNKSQALALGARLIRRDIKCSMNCSKKTTKLLAHACIRLQTYYGVF